METTGATIAATAAVGIRIANRLISDIPAERFGRLASPAGQTIQSNHPAFAIGHLSLYPAEVMKLLGQDPTAVRPPAGYEVFSKDAQCQDDATGTLYSPSSEIIEFFNGSYEVALTALRDASDAQLSADNPRESPIQQLCPTLGSLLNFYVTSHVTLHLGQISAWRRMEGMPPA